MTKLTIPEKFRQGILYLIGFDDTSIDFIVQSLENIPASVSTRRLSSSVKSSVHLPEGQLYEALKALRSLYGARTAEDISLQAFVDELLEAIEDIAPDKASLGTRTEIAARLVKLLGVESVLMYATLRNLKKSDEKSFCRARIHTDLRPVFVGGELSPKAFVLSHLLQVGFHAEGRHQDFYVSLDEDDLATLKEAIASAETKSQSLQSLLEKISSL